MSLIKSLGFLAVTLIALTSIATAGVIYHEKCYPKGDGPFPVVIVLHTAGGFKRIGHLPRRNTDAGFTVYVPDYYGKYGIKVRTRITGFKEHREETQKDLEGLILQIKKDSKIQKQSLFAAGYSAGGFFVCVLANKKLLIQGCHSTAFGKLTMGTIIIQLHILKRICPQFLLFTVRRMPHKN